MATLTLQQFVGVDAVTKEVVRLPQAHIRLDNKAIGIGRLKGNISLYRSVPVSLDGAITDAVMKYFKLDKAPTIVRMADPPPEFMTDIVEAEDTEVDVEG